MDKRKYFWASLLLAGSFLPVQGADVIITLPGAKVDRSVYKANAMDVTNRERAFDLPFTAQAIQVLYREHPNLPTDEALRLVRKAQSDFQLEITHGTTMPNILTDKDAGDLIGIGFKIIAGMVGGGVAGVGQDLFNIGTRNLQENLDAEGKFLAGLQQYQKFSSAHDFQESQWEELSKRCDENQNACIVANLALGPRLNARMNDPASLIVQSNPSLGSNPQVQSLLSKRSANGSYSFSLDETMQQWTAQYDDLKTMLATDHALLVDIDRKQQSFAAYIRNQELRRQTQAEAERNARETQLKYDAANSSVFLLSTILGAHDQKVGEAVRVAGSAAIQVGQALSKYEQAAAEFGDLGSSLGGVVLTGNIVGAVLNLVNLFGGGPTTEQLILQQLQELKQQIADLGRQMEQRFDRVDFSLAAIHSTLVAGLNDIDFTTRTIRSDLKTVQQSLFRVEEGLGRLERELLGAFQDAARIRLQEELNFTFRNTGLRRSRENFAVAENAFFTWAVNTSSDPTFAGPVDVPLSDLQDANVPDKLSERGLTGSLNYLNAFASRRLAVPAFASGQLANPVDWAIGAEAYIQLTRQFPQFDRNVNRASLEQIRQTGLKVSNALKSISLVTEGGSPRANHGLFDKLDSFYRDSATAFKTALTTTESTFRAGINTDPGVQQANSNLDFFATAGQRTTYIPFINPIRICNDVSPRLNPPPNLGNLIPTQFRIAEQLGLGKNDICYAGAGYVDEHTVTGLRQGFVPLAEQRGKLAVHLVGRFGDKRTFSVFIVAASETMILRFVDNGTPTGGGAVSNVTVAEDIVDQNWMGGAGLARVQIPTPDGLVSGVAFVGAPELRNVPANRDISGINRPTLQADLSAITAQVEQRLKQLQREFYGTIANSIRSATQLGAAAKDLTAAKAVYQSFVALGLSRALDNDDTLRVVLFGLDSLPDGNGILTAYQKALAAGSASPDTNLPKVDFDQLLNPAQSLLHDHVSKVLSDIDAGTHRESQYFVDNMLRRIEIQQLVRGRRRRR